MTRLPACLPLLAPRAPGAPLCWRHGQPIAADTFLAQAQALAARLPASGSAVNLCSDRYHFALGFAAALLAGRPSLLPPDARPGTLALLQSTHADVFGLVDAPIAELAGLPQVVVAGGAEVVAALPAPLLDAGQHAASLLTSGSTGTPQPHAKDWRTLWLVMQEGRERLAALLGRPDLAGLTLVGTVPPQHSYGFESTVLLALLGGAAFDACRPFFPADIVATLASVPRPRALVTTPFHLKNLLAAGLDLPSVDLVLSATAPLSPQLAARAEQAFGGPLVEIYGCTEAGQVATRRTTAGEWWETFDGLRIEAEEGAPGEGTASGSRFLVRGGHVAEPTPLADVLELNGGSRFRLLGRSNDLIHVAGKRSSLGHLDFHLNSIPGVLDGAFWLPDEVADGVVRPVAFVVAPGLAAHEVIAGLRERLEPVFVPRKVVFVDALPRVETGKLTAGALRKLALSLLAEPAATPLAPDPDTFHAIRPVPADHPAFAGHFPGQPLLPGALLLAEVQEVLSAAPGWRDWLGQGPLQLSAAKFLAPVRPGDLLAVVLQRTATGTRVVDFTLQVGATVVARGRWTGGTA